MKSAINEMMNPKIAKKNFMKQVHIKQNVPEN